MKIGIVIGSIREGRLGEGVGRWVEAAVAERTGVDVQVIDLKSFDVPLFTSSTNPMMANREYDSPSVGAWSAAIDDCDAFIFVTAEYNHGVPGGFKNAFDSLAPEWVDKTVGFVSYGADNGVRAVEHWRQIVANFHMVAVRGQVSLSLFTEFDQDGNVTPEARRGDELATMIDQIVAKTRVAVPVR